MSGDEIAVRALASGRVQGVGYRQSVVAEARRVGVLGWVRNEDDGTVRVHAEGPESAVDELVAFLRTGPPGAEVTSVEVDEAKVEGHEQFAIRGVSAGRFVVEQTGEGDGTRYVVRLEVHGAWRSWSMRKEPSMVPADKRFASPLADWSAPAGPADAGEAFTIGLSTPADAVGGSGPAALDDATDNAAATWDHGTYEQGGRVAWPEAIERGHAVFVLHGSRLRGGFALQRIRGNQWLLIKRRDEFAA